LVQHVLLLDVQEPADRALGARLAQCGFVVEQALRCYRTGLQQHQPILSVLRVGVTTEDIHGIVSALPQAPLLAICASNDERLVTRCLDAGVDMVVCEPVSRRELAARLSVLLARRSDGFPPGESRRLDLGDLAIDEGERRVTLAGRSITLTPTEFRLLTALARRCGRVVSHADLLFEAWGAYAIDRPDQLRPYVRHLRRKLNDDAQHPKLLLTERGVGYMLAAPVTNEATHVA